MPYDTSGRWVPEEAIAQQYRYADQLQRQPEARSWAGVLAHGLGGLGSGIMRSDAQKALQSNQGMMSKALRGTLDMEPQDIPKAFASSGVPSLETAGAKALMDDPNKEYRVRAAQWKGMGYGPRDAGYREWVLTGKLPGMNEHNKFGLNPLFGVDSDGNPVIMQLNTAGGASPVQMPKGVVPSKAPIKMDAGTHYILLDPITRQTIGEIPKDLAGAEAAKAEGEAIGKAKINLPLVELNAEKLTKNIDAVLEDPYLPTMVGPVSGMLPNVSGKSQKLQSRIDQIQGQTFLQAFNAYNRLANMKVDDPDYVEALREFKMEVADLLDVARRKAGQPAQRRYSGSGTPRVSTTEDYEALPTGTRYIDPNGVERTKR
jgi:hypothetical protein